jgi:hypothetical protein
MGFISLADVEAEKEAGTTKGADPTEKSGFTPIEDTGFTPVKGRTWGEFGKDVALSAVQGVDMLAKLPAMAYDKATTGNWYGPETQKISAMSDERERLKSEESQVKSRQKAQIAKSAGQAARAHVGEGAIGTAAQVATEFGVSFWEAAKDPASIPEFVAQQAAQLGVMGKVGRGAEVAAQGVAKAAPRAAATRAGQVAIGNAGTAAAVGTGATLQGVDVGSDTMQRLMALPDALWQENPEYVALAREIGPQAAKERVASRLATDATLKAGAVSVATAALPGGSAIERALVGKGTGLKAVPRAFAGEAGQEGAEEGSGAYFGNKTVQQIDASQDAFEGVGTAAGQGAFMGGVMGGGISAGAAMAKRAASPKEAEIEAALNAQTMGADPATGMIPAAKSGVASPSGDGGLQGAHQGADERLPRSAAVDSAPEVRLAELEILAQSRELSPVEKREAQSLVEQIAQSELEAEASPVAQTPSGSAGRTIASDRNYSSPQVDGNVMPAAAESSMESADLPGTGFIPIAQTQADTSGRGGFQIQALETNDPAATELMLPTRGQDLQRQALQNRDRSRAASVAQMADIARNPDYLRLATSRSPETGAPMVFAVGDARVGVPAENIGKTDVAVMSDGQRVPFQYAVVDASTVEPSNFADGRSNPAFAADVIGTLKALSNGRTAGLRAAYEEGTAQAYQAELMADVEAHGVPVEAIQRTPNPILVRVYSERLNTPDMATKSQGQALGMSPVELAIQDARLITTHALASLQPGDVASAANRDFVRTFIGQLQQSGLDVAGLMTADGTLSPSGRQRLQAAVMQAAYGDVELVTELFDSLDNDIKSIGEALKVMAGEWANLRDSARQGAINPAVDITGNLVQAVNLVRRARRDRVSLFDLTRQPDLMTGQTPDVITVGALRFFYGGSYFARALGRDAMISMLRDYVRSAMTTGADADMFGEQVSPDLILASFENQGVSDAKNSAEERGRTPDGRPVAGRRADEARPGKQRHGGDEGVSGVGRTGGQGSAQSGSDSAPNTRTATSLDLQALDALRREALQIARTGAFAKQGLTFEPAGDQLAVMFKGQEIARLDGARSRENIVKAIKAAIAGAAPDAAELVGDPVQVVTGRAEAQPIAADRFPSVATVTGLSVGPGGVITPRVIAPGQPLYRETNLGGLDDLMRTDAQAEVAAFFVADNADLALGQGDNKGVQVVFRPDALSGRENRKPATGDIAGREYKTDMMAPRAVQTITMKAVDVPRLRGITRRALADFEKEVIGGGLVRYHRKGLPRVEAAPVLTSPTPDAVVAQQERTAQADALDAREQVKRESEAGAGQFELAREDGRQDTTGDIFAQAKAEPKSEQQAEPQATDATEKKPARARKPADKAPAAEPVNQDVGEQLYANRRNFTGRGVRWDDVRELNDTLKLKEVTKAKVWPRPDYEKLVADGMPQVIARLVKQVYDGISAGPTMAGGKAPSDADLQRYIDTLGKVREGLFAFVNDGQRVAAFAQGVLATVKRDAAAIGPVSVIDLARDAMDPQGVASVLLRQVWPEQFAAGVPTMGRFTRGSDAQKEASIIGGNKALGAMQFMRDDLRKWVADLENGWPAKREAWQVQGYRVLGPEEYETIGREQPDGSVRMLIGRPGKRGSWQANLSAEQLAESPFLLVQDGGLGAQAFKTREAAIDAAREKVKRQAGVGQDIRGTNIEDAERTGPARRQDGEDITSQRLMDTFGFRGVNFGREGWINQVERQAYLNQAFDGLMDLADVLGVPSRAMSLDGKLGIAFGAQGKGRNAAHFVPGYNEINLTRTKGAGTLAHEWGHALDHHFALQAGLEKDAEPFLSQHAHRGDKSNRMVFEDGRYVAKKDVPTFGDGIRPEIVRAFRDVYQAMNKRNETPEEAETRSQSNQALAARRLEQWTRAARRQIEDSTATNKAELLGQFDQHAEKMRQGDLGDGYEKSGNKAFSSRVAAVRSLIKDATGRLWSADETSGLEAAASFVRSLAGGRDAGIAHEPQKVGTQYKRDSAAMDAEKGGKAYWSTSAEMFARAFELYVHDKMAQRGASNTFLTDAQQRAAKPAQVPDNSSAMNRASGAMRDLYLYPVGQERDTLRGAFDDLVQAIETREAEDGNITLLSRRDDGPEADDATDRLDFPKLQALAQRLKARMPNMPKVHVLEDPAKAPKALREYIIRQDAWHDVEGAMHDGELYLFASGLADEARAEHVLLEHEAAHYGLRAILGPSLQTAMRLVYIQNASVRRAVAELQKRGKLSDLVATEEVIVDIPTAELARLKGWRKVVDQVRAWLAERGYTALAERIGAWLQGTLSQQQRADLFVAELVGAARDYVAGKVPARAPVGMGTRLSGTLAEDIERQEKWLQREAKARGFKDIEDLLARDYPLFEKLAELWRKKNPAEVLLSRSPDTQAAYEARIDALFDGQKPALAGARVLDRSDVLDMLGFGAGPVNLAENKVVASRANHPFMTAAVWKKVPQWLENPAAVFDSDTQPGRLVFIAPELVNGAPVRIILEPNANGVDAHLLVNAYDAERSPFQRWEKDGLLRYFDRQKATPVTGSFQPRLAGLPGQQGRSKILTEKNLAGYRRAQGADGARLSRAAPGKGPGKGNAWTQAKAKVVELTSPAAIDRLLYEFQDKLIDLRRMRDHIKEIGGAITDLNDAYLGEELYHKRLAKRSADFLDKELKPLLGEMRARAVSLPELEQYLHARHAPEANRVLAERNPNRAILDAKRKKAADAVRDLEVQLQQAKLRGAATAALEESLQIARDEAATWNGAQAFAGTEFERLSLSGMSDVDAKAVIDALPSRKLQHMEHLAATVDKMQGRTLDELEGYGLIDKATLNAWRSSYRFYVPLHRDEAKPESDRHPIGQGFSIKGAGTKTRVGSKEKVTNILAHIAMQREAALTRGEKNNVVKKLYLMAAQNPDSEFWALDSPPKVKSVDSRNGTVRTMVDPTYKNRPNVVMVRIAGQDRAVVFNEHNPSALRLAESMKNLDVGDLHVVLGLVSKGTRWFASVNTQYNPIFGLINFARDVQAGLLNLSTTPLAGKQKEVAKHVPTAVRAIYRQRRGKASRNTRWTALWDEFEKVGGTTGYRDLFSDADDRAKALVRDLQAMERGQVSKAAHAIVDWLSDYNEVMENAVRLSAYKVATEQGMSKEQAASLAKNLTVNFNRKGRQTRWLGALFAFFNAALQGTARMVETLRGPAGKRIMFGGVALGMINTLIGMAMMGAGDDDEPDNWEKIPEFVKERSIVIPLGREDYLAIPMPLGFHVLPNIGRLAVESAFAEDGKSIGRRMGEMLSVVIDAFNPLGGTQNMGQMVTPTVLDPVVALWQNRDWTGRPIYREDFSDSNRTPGFTRTKDSASTLSKSLAEAINSVTGGSEYRQGFWSPTPDQLDYVFGQLTGGLGREMIKVNQSLSATVTGDELPPHKVPLLGRLYGNTRGTAGQSGQYYENLRQINEVEGELKGRWRKDDAPQEFERREPLTGAVELAKQVESRIRVLRRERSELEQDKPAGYQERKRQIDAEIAMAMTDLNNKVTRLRKEAKDDAR